MSIKLVIADDDELIRESLKIILSYDKEIEIVDAFENGKELVDFLLKNTIDIALVDVRMPLVNGVKATLEISQNTATKVIILTTFDEDEYIREGMEEIRMTLRNIKPSEEELGINRIRKILDEKIKDTDIKGKVTYNGDLDKVNSNQLIIISNN